MVHGLKVILRVKWNMAEGEIFEPVKVVATVTGKARFLLLGERVALNLLARCSGIATKFVQLICLWPCLIIGYGWQVSEIQGHCTFKWI